MSWPAPGSAARLAGIRPPAAAIALPLGAVGLTLAIAGFGAGVAVTVSACLWSSACLIVRRRLFSPGEGRVWTLLLSGAAVLATATLTGPLAAATRHSTADSHRAGLVVAVGDVLAALLFYQALIHWNRVRTPRADPGDWLNGLSALLVAAAIGNAVLPESALPQGGLIAWEHQAALCAVSAGLVLTGTATTLCFLSGLRRDPRLWLLVMAMATMTSPSAGVLMAREGRPLGDTLSLLAVLVITVAANRPRPPLLPAFASAQATTRGALFVMFIGMTVLLLAGGVRGHTPLLVSMYAGTAVILVGARILGLVRDLEQLSATREQAVTDELTGIGNRRAFMSHVHERTQNGQSTCLLLLDLDDFKRVNDRHGHTTGDEVLQDVAQTLTRFKPSAAAVFRLGGDEFAIVLPSALGTESLELARALVDAPTHAHDGAGRTLRIRASVGIADLTVSRHGQTVSVLHGQGDHEKLQLLDTDAATDLLRRADVAMYRAKEARTGVAVYDAQLDARVQQEFSLLEDLYDALESPRSTSICEFEAYFQPQLDAATGWVVGAEALVRWNHSRHGVLPPDQWLPLAESKGLLTHITPFILRQAAEQWHCLTEQGHMLRVSVNLSASSLTEPALLVQLDEIIDAGMEPSAMVLEITETALMADPEHALVQLWAIRERGFGISIDDYGTGFSSLSYLRDLPATELKIDRSFVQRLVSDSRTRQIVSATADLAHGLGMRLVGEGVEDQETLSLLSALGCDETQGYLHARPMPASEFHKWMSHQPTFLEVGEATVLPVHPKGRIE